MNNVIYISPRGMMIPFKYLLYSVIDWKNIYVLEEKLKF